MPWLWFQGRLSLLCRPFIRILEERVLNNSLIIKHFKYKKSCTNSLRIKMRKVRINSAMCCVTWLCNWVSTLYTLNSDTKVSICFVHFRLHLNNNETRRCLKNHFSGISNNLVIRNTCFEKIFILQQNLSWPRIFSHFSATQKWCASVICLVSSCSSQIISLSY